MTSGSPDSSSCTSALARMSTLIPGAKSTTLHVSAGQFALQCASESQKSGAQGLRAGTAQPEIASQRHRCRVPPPPGRIGEPRVHRAQQVDVVRAVE